MTTRRTLALVVALVLLITAVTPARAEAFEVGTGLLIAGAVVVVVIIVAFLIIANVSERQKVAAGETDSRVAAEEPETRVVVIALEPRPAETP
jgi:hypothetical protein